MSADAAPRIAVVPSPPALLPSYAGRQDPLPEVRAAAVEACRWLLAPGPSEVVVLADALGARVGASLLAAAGWTGAVRAVGVPGEAGVPPDPGAPAAPPDALLVVADGSARRTEKAPGHLDGRAHPYDERTGRALAAGDAATLADLDTDLGVELLAAGTPALRALGALVGTRSVSAEVDYEGDPFGVAYWVVRWTCSS